MGINKAERSGEVTFTLGAVTMNCRGLVDPKNKPFGRVLPLEVQIKIMFWVECFYTMDKRKKLLQEFKGLAKCDVTGLTQHLGQDQWWTQWCFACIRPGQPIVIIATEYSTTSYR